MGKDKKQQIKEYKYDEASSGSDDSDSSDEESEAVLHSVKSGVVDENDNRPERRKESTSDDESDSIYSSEESSSDSDADSDIHSESEEEVETNKNRPVDDDWADQHSDNDNSDNDQESDSSDEEDVPLHQRLVKREGRAIMQRSSRFERKSRALEEATKRLATFKEKRQEKNNRKTMGAASDDDGDSVETSTNRATKEPKKNITTTKKKKKNKHRPTEVSSKRADFFARGALRLNESGLGVNIGAHRYKPMDPRASNLSGHFDEDRFHKNYAFLEEMRNREIGQVRKRIAAHKATGNKGNRLRRKLQITQADGSHSSTLEEDVARLKALTQNRANLERRKIDRAARQSVKRKIREDVESGKSGAYFLKRKEKKRLELEARFEEIQKRGGEKAVEKILAKKRQKNKSRDSSGFAK